MHFEEGTIGSDGARTPERPQHGRRPSKKVVVRRQALAALTAVLTLIVASASVPSSSASPVPGSASQPYDLASQSDRELQHFDRTHPDCELWTDWRKLCSRMGLGGATRCRTDRRFPARPSEPFCAEGEPPNADTLSEAMSRSRYCSRFNDDLSPQQTEPKGAHYCDLYRSSRPFNGQQIAQMETPGCLEWTSGSVTCVSGRSGKRRGRSCASTAIEPLERPFPFSCTRWSKRTECPHPVGGAELESGPTSILMEQLQIGRPVWGAYCKRTVE